MNTTNIGKYKVYYNNQKEFHILKSEIFGNNCYYFPLNTKYPYILDIGSYIGLSVIFFKDAYPEARIKAFEPSPYARELLKENIFINNLQHITVLPYAIDSSNSRKRFYIDISKNQWQSTAGFSEKSWNKQYTNNLCIETETRKLSTYLNKSIDILKIDIEGAEEKVLKEAKDLLRNVKNIVLEYHPIKKQYFKKIISILKNSGFSIVIFKDGKEIKTASGDDLLIIKGTRI